MTRREQFEKALWDLYDTDSYYARRHAEILTEYAYPEFKGVRIETCDKCHRDFICEVAERDNCFCSEKCEAEYPEYIKNSRSVDPKEFLKAAEEIFIPKLKELSEERISIWDRFRGI